PCEADALQVARQSLALGHLRYLVEHVPVEHVDQNVENAASRHLKVSAPGLSATPRWLSRPGRLRASETGARLKCGASNSIFRGLSNRWRVFRVRAAFLTH